MGTCFSATKVVSGSNTTSHRHKKQQQHDSPNRKRCQQQQQQRPPHKATSTRHVPCGKRTDFGYDKDFDKRYSLGKLLGHGQFGYTYVAIDKANGHRVAVKRLDKSKVFALVLSIYNRLVRISVTVTEYWSVWWFCLRS